MNLLRNYGDDDTDNDGNNGNIGSPPDNRANGAVDPPPGGGANDEMIEMRKLRKAPLIVNRPKVPLPAALPEAHRARIDPEGRNLVRSRESRRLAFLYERAGKTLKN